MWFFLILSLITIASSISIMNGHHVTSTCLHENQLCKTRLILVFTQKKTQTQICDLQVQGRHESALISSNICCVCLCFVCVYCIKFEAYDKIKRTKGDAITNGKTNETKPASTITHLSIWGCRDVICLRGWYKKIYYISQIPQRNINRQFKMIYTQIPTTYIQCRHSNSNTQNQSGLWDIFETSNRT